MSKAISRMPNLEKLILSISRSSKEAFIPKFYGLKNLRYLNITGNSFIGNILFSIGDLPKLKYLNIYSTNLNGIFLIEIGKLTNLKGLCFHHNENFDGPLPSSIGKLTNLETINIFSHSIIGIFLQLC